MLQIALSDRIIQDVAGPALGAPARLAGRPVSELWRASERLALERRLDDVLLLGHDRFGAVALAPSLGAIWVEVEASYHYRDGERLELRLRRLPGPGPKGGPGVADAAEPAAREVAAEPRPSRRPAREEAPGPSRAEALAFEALRLAGAAALELGENARVRRATPACERLLGRPAGLLVGARLEELVALEPEAARALAEARAAGAAQSVLAGPVDGEQRLALDWLAGASGGAGLAILSAQQREPVGTERLRFQAQLVSSVAHDVRDSLAAVFCGLRTIAQELPADHPLQETVTRSMAESERANRITEDVLWISRPGDLKRIELDLDMVVLDTLARYRKRAGASGVEIESDLRSGCRVLADLSSIERVLGNLVENALDATPRGGALRIATRREARAAPGVRIEIRDTGMGIKEETRPNVFEPFVTDKHGGTGLGLAIARRVVLDHGGQIHFETQEGRGTTFHVWLPLSEV